MIDLTRTIKKIRRKLNPYIFTQQDFPSLLQQNCKPLLMVCGRGFDQTLPTASTLWMTGLARGWADACGPARLVPDRDIIREMNGRECPAVFMSIYNFSALNDNECRRLRDVDLFIYILIHPDRVQEWRRHALIPESDIKVITESYRKIMLAEPKFFWNSSGAASLSWCDGWIKEGVKKEQIYLAADPNRYYPDRNQAKFGQIQMAYVGGYWPEKALAYDRYLRPWEDILQTYGNDPWPYRNYGGQIDETGERQLYSTAGLIPLVTTPAGWDVGELTERYFKTPACNAFCIADHNSSLNEVYTTDEMLRADSAEQFHELVREYMAGKIDTDHWRQKSREAVMKKHLYRHRALQIRAALAGSDRD
jgi:hypothetical protein